MKMAESNHTKHHQSAQFTMSASCEESLLRFIRQRTGIVLQDHQLGNLRATVARACGHFSHDCCEAYLLALQNQPRIAPELEFLVSGITVGESYFFRDAEQIGLLRNTLLPEMIARKRLAGDRVLRIWSAGCSVGQEIYTVALLLQELLPDIRNWTIHLLGTDINAEVLTAAMIGRYSEWSFRATPVAVREKYFTPVGREFELAPQTRSLVRFTYLNLTEDSFPSIMTETNALDMIFCRNVFIYLDRDVIRRVMEKFAACLQPEGVLLLGPSDLVECPDAFCHVRAGETGYYRLSGQGTEANDEMREAQSFLHDDVAAPKPAVPLAEPVAVPDKKQTGGFSPEEKDVIALLKSRHWEAAVELLGKQGGKVAESALLSQFQAKALANLGRYEAALAACGQSLALDPADKHTYLIQGLVLMDAGRNQEAETALRKAIYLDYLCVEAHYQLGVLQLGRGDRRGGLKSLENALSLAEKGDPGREMHDAQDMTYHRFAEILRNEISMYSGVGTDTRRVQSVHRNAHDPKFG
ncbi:MAG: hypothetical protein K8H84_12275 [Sulfuricella denitrificans]|nr:hypothetical protein [Sulfuricella denitrificans]